MIVAGVVVWERFEADQLTISVRVISKLGDSSKARLHSMIKMDGV